jgi:hypothetical protein
MISCSAVNPKKVFARKTLLITPIVAHAPHPHTASPDLPTTRADHHLGIYPIDNGARPETIIITNGTVDQGIEMRMTLRCWRGKWKKGKGSYS